MTSLYKENIFTNTRYDILVKEATLILALKYKETF